MNWKEHFSKIDPSSFGSDETAIRLNSTGDEVKKWQAIIGVTQDGQFGPNTETATKTWQTNHKLASDGVVGPATWAVALGRKIDVPVNINPNDIQVKAKTASSSLGLTPNESLFVRAVGTHETSLGQGWGSTPPPNGGAGSFNMGAITTGGTQTSPYDFAHVDSRNDTGQVITYTTWFKGYPSFEDGIKGLASFLLKQNVKDALKKGDFPGAVVAMYTNKYFLGIHPRNTPEGNAANVNDYVSAVNKALTTIEQHTGDKPQNPPWYTKVGIVLGLAISTGLWYGYTKVKNG